MNPFLATLTDPATLEAAAELVALDPGLEGRVLAAGLRATAAGIRAKKGAEELNAITAKWTAELQTVVDGW